MRVLELEARALGYLHQLVERTQIVSAAEYRIVHRYGRKRPGMDRQRAVVLLCQPGHFAGLGHAGVAAGLVHHSEGKAAGALFQALLHDAEHTLLLLGREFAAIPAGHAGAGRAVAHQHGDVAGILAVNCLEERFDGGVDAGAGAVAVAEEAASDFIQIRGAGLEAYGRQAAVARDERGDALPDEGLHVFEGLFLDAEPVVVRVGVEEAGGYAQAAEVDDFVCTFFQ